MEAFLEYIMLNYTWFLGGAIIILLAIIGYYAEKTNFGQAKEIERKKESLELNEFNDEETIEESDEENQMIDQNIEEMQPEELEQQEVQEEVNEPEVVDVNFEEEFEKFDKEFNEILPEKEIINDDLLDEIDNLSLDKTQKIQLTDIPDLDDVELPKIKNLESVDEDIWKF